MAIRSSRSDFIIIISYFKPINRIGWDVDIYLPQQKIAVMWNVPCHYKQMNMKNQSLLQVQNRDQIKINLFTRMSIKFIVFEDRYFTPETAFLKMVQDVGIEPTRLFSERL